MALMNVLVTFNAHLSLSDTLALVSPSFLFFTPFCPVPHCLLLYFAIWFTFLCFYFVLMKSIWLAFILSRDVFVLTRIKTRVVFPWPPLLTPDEGPSLETSIFSCIVSGSERTFTFRVYNMLQILTQSTQISRLITHFKPSFRLLSFSTGLLFIPDFYPIGKIVSTSLLTYFYFYSKCYRAWPGHCSVSLRFQIGEYP